MAGALSGERRLAAVRARGRVLEVDHALAGVARQGLAVTEVVSLDVSPAVPRATLGAASFDTVVSVGGVSGAPDPGAVLAESFAALRPGGMLLLVEPSRPSGWRGRLALGLVGRAERRVGLRPDLRIVELVRRAGFSLASVERWTMPLPMLSVRWFVRVVAERPPDEPLPDGAGAASRRGGR